MKKDWRINDFSFKNVHTKRVREIDAGPKNSSETRLEIAAG